MSKITTIKYYEEKPDRATQEKLFQDRWCNLLDDYYDLVSVASSDLREKIDKLQSLGIDGMTIVKICEEGSEKFNEITDQIPTVIVDTPFRGYFKPTPTDPTQVEFVKVSDITRPALPNKDYRTFLDHCIHERQMVDKCFDVRGAEVVDGEGRTCVIITYYAPHHSGKRQRLAEVLYQY